MTDETEGIPVYMVCCGEDQERQRPTSLERAAEMRALAEVMNNVKTKSDNAPPRERLRPAC